MKGPRNCTRTGEARQRPTRTPGIARFAGLPISLRIRSRYSALQVAPGRPFAFQGWDQAERHSKARPGRQLQLAMRMSCSGFAVIELGRTAAHPSAVRAIPLDGGAGHLLVSLQADRTQLRAQAWRPTAVSRLHSPMVRLGQPTYFRRCNAHDA